MSFTSRKSRSATTSINGADMAGGVSSFYPPRARWYSPCFSLAAKVRRRLALDRVHLPPGVSIAGVLVSAIVPGTAFYVHGRRSWGNIGLGASAALIFVVIGWFGFPTAAVAFGLLLAIHASGLALLFEPALPTPGFRARLLLTAVMLVVLAGALYLPARHLILDHLFFPLRLNERVIIIHRGTLPATLHHGDTVAYSFEGFSQGELFVRAGYGLGPILALPGDELRFTKSSFEVNGVVQPRLALMPDSGEWKVPEKHWFVWPQFGITTHGYVAGSGFAEGMVSLGTISENQFLGRPCRWWLWRRQL
jgi:hypothetical protein